MPMADVNGARLYYELSGDGDVPLVMVHGGIGSHQVWEPVVPSLAESFRVLNYDRRGHGRSDLPGDQMSVREHVDDLAAMIEELDLAPAWLVGNSSGGSVVFRLCGEQPDLLRGAIVHEPALFGLLEEDPDAAPMLAGAIGAVGNVMEKVASGDETSAAEDFCEAMVGYGTWDPMPTEMRQMMIDNVGRFPKEDVQVITCDPERIRSFEKPVLLTMGDESPPIYAPVIEKLTGILPGPEVVRLNGTGHVPQITHPEAFAQTVEEFIRKRAA